jgi:shikimate kinase / 3-dehydroquinate synthase
MSMSGQRSLVLSGFMATGKSTLGKRVAVELGLPFVDIDEVVATQAGKPTGEVFAREGEARFRDREANVILPLLADGTPRVIAFGGGAVTIPRVRHAALEAATVVTLTARPETIASRAAGALPSGSLADRPNLAAARPVERARDLLALRREVYGECHEIVPTDDRTPDELVARIVAVARRDAVAIPLGARSYAVELGDGEPEVLSRVLLDLAPSRVITVTDANVLAARGAWLDRALAAESGGEGGRAWEETRIVLPPGEASKNLQTVARIWDEALAAGVDRQAVVLAFGGGVVGDLAGFAASTLLRGVRCVQIATSLLAMVDSSVGGKTGFDHAAGKNLLGAFFQPSRVILDLEHLTTLPERQRAAGLAEVVKIALVRDASFFERLEQERARIASGDRALLRDIVREAVRAKMRVVREDEHETGVRALLNLGHTIGHALEAHGGYTRWLHGEAVAIGTVLEIAATERLGLSAPGSAERAAALFTAFGLPTRVPAGDVAAAFPFVMSDKKRTRSAVKLPIVTRIGEGAVAPIEIETLRSALGA